MHDNRSHDHLDDVIDAAARSMTRGVPSESLRTAVRARIEGPATPSLRLPPVRVWQMGLAAASVAVIAFVVGGNLSERSPAPEDVLPARALAIVAAPPSLSPPVPLALKRAAVTAAPAATAAAPAVAVLEPPELIVIDSLDVEPIGAQLVAVDSIPESMPILIEPLRVEPLSME
jgi:hypothetical protein